MCLYIYVDKGEEHMSLEYAILGLLSERPRSGYDLKTRCFNGALKPFWDADQAQIYRTLDRLSVARWVASRRRRQSGKPDRKIYEITQAGLEALGAWLTSPQSSPVLRDPLAVQLYFGSGLSDEDLLGVLTVRRREHQARLDDLRSRSAELAAQHPGDSRAAVLRQTAFDGAMARERAAIDWLDDCIQAVEEGALPGSEETGIGQRHLFGSTSA